MKIIKMQKQHIAAIARLESLCFARPWSEQALADELENENACFLVAENDGEVLGYCGMHHACGECYIDNVAVFPNHRRKGVAAALLNELENNGRALGGEFISLEVRPTNTGAISLYKSLGYAEVGRRKNFYTDPCEDALIMTKNF